ncbi:hypothetical protein T440DRAFT_462828 [Plenodomus tracheiphilus IPT5]|uniref:Tim44-like domain-containing protein n=1 Tax=Plenodomus tracheiphilus IPT5 TaxID=1408161 RepID=A0A6A7BMA7_9PLEO|nr:hypothetical protein T440DRAFT_462828 [Plenodomus tracheiphilus IPT5]
MATQIPLRSVRIPALQRQCLFLRHQHLNRPFVAAASRTFSSTPAHARGAKDNRLRNDPAMTRAAVTSDTGPSPRVRAEQQQRSDIGLVEDIGLLQGTIIRAPLSELPKIRTKAFWSYLWALLKSKGVALYSRSNHRRSLQKQRITRFLPVDAFQNKALKDRAKDIYKQMYTNFAEGNIKALEKLCLPPLAKQFRDRITARSDLEVTWKLQDWNSVKILSHRSAPLGEDQPDTAYRQVVFRLETLQSITRKQKDTAVVATASKAASAKTLRKPSWVPEEAREKFKHPPKPKTGDSKVSAVSREFTDNGEPKTVVEYLVLQKRAVRGAEGDWKVWGFTEVSTPETMKSDEEYWSKQLAVQAAHAT